MAKAVTYLHDHARHWWQQAGSMLMPVEPTLDDFSRAFLARFVKPSDSAAARKELLTLKQTDSVEAFAAHFRNVNSRITVGSAIDTTTLAGYFVTGLKARLAEALATVTSLPTMQDLDLVIAAAEEMEAKLNLAAKQAIPSVAMVTQADANVAQRGGKKSGKQYGQQPANTGRGYPYQGRGRGR